jgi:hypothetical protein
VYFIRVCIFVRVRTAFCRPLCLVPVGLTLTTSGSTSCPIASRKGE